MVLLEMNFTKEIDSEVWSGLLKVRMLKNNLNPHIWFPPQESQRLILKQVGTRDRVLQQEKSVACRRVKIQEQVSPVLCRGIFIPTGSQPCCLIWRASTPQSPFEEPPSATLNLLVLGTAI